MRAIIYFLFLLVSTGSFFTAHAQKMPQLGIVDSLERDTLAYASGYRLFGETVDRMLSASLTEEQFQKNLNTIKNAKNKLYLCNVLFQSN